MAELLSNKLDSALGGDNLMHRLLALEHLAYTDGIKPFKRLLDNLQHEDPLNSHLALNGLVEKQEPYALIKLFELRGKNGRNAAQLNQAIDHLKDCARESLTLIDTHCLCRDCLRRFRAYRIKTGMMSSISFAGCGECGLTNNRLEGIATVVAVLVDPWEKRTYREGDSLYVNMLMRDRKNYMVDFDILEVREAPSIKLDEEVQFFLMCAGEDNLMNQTRLKKVPARLKGKPKLNMNSLNLLRFKMAAQFAMPEMDEDGRLRYAE
jgi:hypothetical protein